MKDKAIIETTCNIYRCLVDFAKRKHVFTTVELREELSYNETAPEVRRVHAVIQARKRDGVISVVSQGKKRHQHLQVKPARVKDLERLFEKALRTMTKNHSGAINTSPETSLPATLPKRVVYLEDRVERVAKELVGIVPLKDEVRQLKDEVRQLVKLWS